MISKDLQNFDVINEYVYLNMLIKYIIFSTIHKNERRMKEKYFSACIKSRFRKFFFCNISIKNILYYLRKYLCCYNYYLHLSHALRSIALFNIFMRICNINELLHYSNTRVNSIWSTFM